jgi:hypothetical protein
MHSGKMALHPSGQVRAHEELCHVVWCGEYRSMKVSTWKKPKTTVEQGNNLRTDE